VRPWFVALVLALCAESARADVDNARADQLFREGVALRKINPREACAKFAQALEFNPQSITTRLNLALCDEEFGRLASAVNKWAEIADRARDQKLTEYEALATQHIDALLPEVPYISIKLAEPAPGIQVLVDAEVVAMQRIAKLAVDPGEHEIVVTAPNRVAFRRAITVPKQTTLTVAVPALAAAATNAPRRWFAAGVVAVGGATLVTAGITGLVARSRYAAAERDECNEVFCSLEGVRRIDDARRLGNIATIVSIFGAATVIGGGVVWWRDRTRTKEPPRVTLAPTVAPDGVGVVAVGRF
jgi:hypothetical protein